MVERVDAEERVSSTGVPTPSVLVVSTLLARLRLLLLVLALEGARPSSWRLRRTRAGGCAVVGGLDWARERAFWWWRRREEMVEERAGGWDGGLDGGSVALDGEGEGFGGERLAEISWSGVESSVVG